MNVCFFWKNLEIGTKVIRFDTIQTSFVPTQTCFIPIYVCFGTKVITIVTNRICFIPTGITFVPKQMSGGSILITLWMMVIGDVPNQICFNPIDVWFVLTRSSFGIILITIVTKHYLVSFLMGKKLIIHLLFLRINILFLLLLIGNSNNMDINRSMNHRNLFLQNLYKYRLKMKSF